MNDRRCWYFSQDFYSSVGLRCSSLIGNYLDEIQEIVMLMQNPAKSQTSSVSTLKRPSSEHEISISAIVSPLEYDSMVSRFIKHIAINA